MTSLSLSAERRSNRRFSFPSPVRYRAANGPLNASWKHGSGLNMSAGGILIRVPETLAVGTKLQIAMDWTGLYHGREAMRLFLVAFVTRVDSQGVALRIVSHRFRDVTPERVRIPRKDKNLAVA
jgi:c-di-GMP-binding flagellar brake protein YcgR